MEFKDQIAAQRLLETLTQKVISKSYNNYHTTIAASRGAGKPFQLRYILNNYDKIQKVTEDRLFGWIDLQSLFQNYSSGYSNMLMFLANQYSETFENETKGMFLQTVQQESINLLDILQLIKHLTQTYNLTFVVENTRKLYDSNSKASKLADILMQILTIAPNKISYIFIVDKEFTEETAEKVGHLWNYVVSDITWDTDMFFDKDSITAAFLLHEKEFGFKFSTKFKSTITPRVLGDPTTLKKSLMLAINDKEFIKAIENSTEIAHIYTLIGTEWLDKRYIAILRNLEENSINALQSPQQKQTKFTLNTGLITEKSGKYTLMNNLFEYFINKRLPKLDWKLLFKQDPKEYLSGQEVLLLELLERNKGEIVDRETMAQTVWGDDWEEKYSDWGLDKVVSNMRKKLTDNDFAKELKTVRGKGVLLT